MRGPLGAYSLASGKEGAQGGCPAPLVWQDTSQQGHLGPASQCSSGNLCDLPPRIRQKPRSTVEKQPGLRSLQDTLLLALGPRGESTQRLYPSAELSRAPCLLRVGSSAWLESQWVMLALELVLKPHSHRETNMKPCLHRVQSVVPYGWESQPEILHDQEKLLSQAHSPVQSRNPSSGPALPGNTARDLWPVVETVHQEYDTKQSCLSEMER